MKLSASFNAFVVLSCISMTGAHALDIDISIGGGSQSSVSSGWQLSQHLGNLSPYFKAPVPKGIQEDLPEDCTVDQIMTMIRHGSRYPLASELPFITNLVAKLGNHTADIQKAKLPGNLQFLKDGYTSTLGHDDLTAPGRAQLFQHGIDFRLNYPQLNATTILAGLQDRVVESAQWWAQGYFGRAWAGLNATAFSTIPENNVTASWITPMNTCKKWDYNFGNNATIEWGSIYLPPITKRLNKALPHVNLTNDDIHGALYACAYDLAAHGVSPWCNAFSSTEIENFEYELDLLMDGAFGYNLPGSMETTLGSVFINKLVERFSNATAQKVFVEFGHDTTIDMALSALGLVQDKPALSAKGPVRPNRKFRTALQVPFAAQMTWEKFTCSSTSKTPQIRLMLNGSPLPLSICKKMDKKYGSCAFQDFIDVNKEQLSLKWGDNNWNTTCGDPGF
ncbi:acid phosphatase pho5 [Steccherinum ochraceum]|uniref:Acid phosphatase pho5 n=1 Tax=Steccherinum ochraceum TaxID=92696 RepID=A0A4R0RMS5_9APHY|nr:acid phosphatase pho5 [Steccherinum ochraceum]